MKIRQGAAPSVLYQDGKKVWEFTAGVLDMRPFDPELYALLLRRGAQPLEPPPQTTDTKPIDRTPEPEPDSEAIPIGVPGTEG